MGRATARRRVLRLDVAAGSALARPDELAVEEPLELRVGGTALSVTMRTPGADVDLVIGSLLTEGVIRSGDQVRTARYCAGTDADGLNTYNVLDVELDPDVPPPAATLARSSYTSSACGVCGKASIDAIRTRSSYDVAVDPVDVDPGVLVTMPDTLRAAQRTFASTGGLHAAGVFDAAGTLLCLREDVGRHNAVDKVVGWAAREDRLPLTGCVLMVSGRASFELVQKAVMAGIPALAAVSAPSSLAVELAEATGLTLVGFLRGSRMNVYAGAHRVAGQPVP